MSAEKRRPSLNRPGKPKLRSGLVPPGIFLLSALLVCGILFWNRPLGFEQQEFVPGEPALRSYFSPVSFSFIDERKTDAARAEKVRGLPPVYRTDAALTRKVFESVDQFFKLVAEAGEERRRTRETRWKELPFTVAKQTLETLVDSNELELIKAQTVSVIGHYLEEGLLSREEQRRLIESGVASVLFVREGPRQEAVVKTEDILTVESALEDVPAQIDVKFEPKKNLRSAMAQVVRAALTGNVVFDEARTRELRKKIETSVAPVEVRIKKNELIVQRGMLVTEEIKDRLDQIHRKLAARKQRVQVLAGSLLIFLLYLFSYFYMAVFEPKFIKSRSKLLLFHAVILISLLMSKAVTLFPDVSIYLMPTVLAALLLTLLLNSRGGLLGGIVMTVLSGFLSGFRVDIMLAALLASVAATFLAYRVRKRSQFLGIGLGVGGAYFLVIAGFQLVQNTPWRDAVQFGALGFLNSIFAVMAGFLVLPLLESCFDIVTDVSLLELSDLNHPLIRKMMVEAPGTYHHSLVVSSLAENACEQIGAHALLARVGCYFHDIGKMERPDFFSENQGYLYPNQHDSLPPKISFEIIVNHIRQGVRLAHKHKLKRAIIDFISEHQGTGVVYYFYKKAMDLAPPDEHIRADDFRYPGPKPQTKETAVALLADSVEAASRALKEPTPDAIQQLVRKIINDKFIDGQLDECELALQDLHKIQACFTRNLAAIFHTRMKYPAVERPESAPDIFGVNQFSKFRANG
jgi:putative nucleotidyltransferase with HDIG domain